MDLNPYTPPQADAESESSKLGDSGRLWRVVDGRLQVRHLASLPDVCVSGTSEGEAGGRHSVVMRRVPTWVTGAIWIVVGALAFGAKVPFGPPIFFLLALANALPAAVSKEPQVFFFRSNSASRSGTIRNWSWAVAILAAVAAVLYLEGGGDRYRASGPMDIVAMVLGVALLARSLRGGGFGMARKRRGGWYELEGIAPAAIVRLEEIQRESPPDMEPPLSFRKR